MTADEQLGELLDLLERGIAESEELKRLSDEKLAELHEAVRQLEEAG